MGDYISRKALFHAVEDYASTHPVMNDNELFTLFCSVPAADVRPVVRVRWKAKDFHTVPCSECGFDMDIMTVDDHVLNHANFCPNCGADMREENEG